MKAEAIPSRLINMINHKHLRKLLAKKIDDYIYNSIAKNNSEDLKRVGLKRYQFLSAMLHCVIRNVDKGYVSGEIINIDVFVQNNLIRGDQSYEQTIERFREKYGELPPTFIVFSPTQKCNLHCIGCYANSDSHTAATVPIIMWTKLSLKCMMHLAAGLLPSVAGNLLRTKARIRPSWTSSGNTMICFSWYTPMVR